MIRAIVYASTTGHTKQYAELFGKTVGLPVYDCNAAIRECSKGTEIIYLGWLMAGTIKGYQKAKKHFAVKAIGSVGMAGDDSQLATIRKTNHIPDNLPLFYLQGGFDMNQLHGIYRLMMQTMKSTVGKALSNKQNRTPEEDDMLQLLLHGGNRVSVDRLSDLVQWYQQNARA